MIVVKLTIKNQWGLLNYKHESQAIRDKVHGWKETVTVLFANEGQHRNDSVSRGGFTVNLMKLKLQGPSLERIFARSHSKALGEALANLTAHM
jgi:hypothetical protein